jgi:hypothetical protein
MARPVPIPQKLRWRRRTKTPPRRTPPNATAEADQTEHASRHPRHAIVTRNSHGTLPSPAGPAGLTARGPRLRDSAKNARVFAFSFYLFCHNRKGGREDRSAPSTKPRGIDAIRFRSEHFWSPKPALLDRLHLRILANIIITFSSLRRKPQAGMGTLPPVACKTVKL